MKLLVCTDLSPRNDIAIQRAIQLAGSSGEVCVIHIIDDALDTEIQKMATEAAMSRIEATLAEMDPPPGPDIKIEVTSGSSARTIARIAELQKADLVIFGAHRPFSGAFRGIGSTIEKVLKSTHIPALVVKTRSKGPYTQAIVGVDFSPHSRRAVQFAPIVAPEADIHLVHSFLNYRHSTDTNARAHALETEHRHLLQRMLLEDHERDTAPPMLIEQDEPIGLIRDQVAEKQADLLVVGSSTHSGLARIALGSVAEDLVTNPPCDLLVVHAV